MLSCLVDYTINNTWHKIKVTGNSVEEIKEKIVLEVVKKRNGEYWCIEWLCNQMPGKYF